MKTNPARNNARSSQLPHTTSTKNTVKTNPARNNARSSQVGTNSVRLQSITEEHLPHPTNTTVRKTFKNGTLNGKITSYDEDRGYYMIEYEDGDSEELRHTRQWKDT